MEVSVSNTNPEVTVMGVYADNLVKSRGDKSATQIREDKCSRSKERNVQRRNNKAPQIQERLDYWRSLSLQEQLKELDKRPGNSTKQRQKILAKIL